MALFMLAMFAACDNEFGVGQEQVALRIGETVELRMKNASGKCMAEVAEPAIVQATVEHGRLSLFATGEGGRLPCVWRMRRTRWRK